jgi:O-acetyl-ADP-ribose deacetylase (regulator of RNase III)
MHRVKSVAFPGMGTGVGRVPPVNCALQMWVAIEEVVLRNPDFLSFPESWREAQLRHMALYTLRRGDLQHPA